MLAPSYKALFDNFDLLINNKGYSNSKGLHLKCLAISGLPVDDIPCVEIWETDKIVFSSHGSNNKVSNKCTWSSEYGDGFFRIAHDITGDFSLMCRFGGPHAAIKDKTTLIFKYQNHAGKPMVCHYICTVVTCCYLSQASCPAKWWSSSGVTST